MMVLYVYSLVFLRRSPRGTDKLKELSRQPVVVERVEQLLADSDPRVRQVSSINQVWELPSFFLILITFNKGLESLYFSLLLLSYLSD
jgi:hypothetical protein